ncbi:MAG TPA: hypothetical protein VE972_10550 [Conexibacter sp.]|nr:hypothetical protein [Conexibacter sp.]
MDFLIIVVVLCVVVAIVGAPLRRRGEQEVESPEVGELADLEAAKEAKYREIRDAELDHRTGKLSEEDWRALDRALRGEAVVLLKRLDELRDRAAAVS